MQSTKSLDIFIIHARHICTKLMYVTKYYVCDDCSVRVYANSDCSIGVSQSPMMKNYSGSIFEYLLHIICTILTAFRCVYLCIKVEVVITIQFVCKIIGAQRNCISFYCICLYTLTLFVFLYSMVYHYIIRFLIDKM